MNILEHVALYELEIAAFFLIMGAIGFVVFRTNKPTDQLSEEDKLDVIKHKRIGYMFSGAQILIGLYFLLIYFGFMDKLY